MQKYVIPFTGGPHSLQVVTWALQRNVGVHFVYVTNLFPKNGMLELQSVLEYIRHLRDYWHEPCGSIREGKWSYHFTMYTIQPGECDVNAPWEVKMAYLVGLCKMVAENVKATHVLVPPRAPIPLIATEEAKTPLEYMRCPVEEDAFQSLLTFYLDELNAHDDQEVMDAQDWSVETYDDPFDSRENPHAGTRYRGHFDREFPFWTFLFCCDKASGDQQLLEGDALPRLCGHCRGCMMARDFISREVEEYAEAQDVDMSEEDELGEDERLQNPQPVKRAKRVT